MKAAVLLLLAIAVCGFAQSAPDLLKDVAGRPAMALEDFEKLALSMNPTLRQATALIQQSAAEARQAGLYPESCGRISRRADSRRFVRGRGTGRIYSAKVRAWRKARAAA